jgi:hypothetical protein
MSPIRDSISQRFAIDLQSSSRPVAILGYHRAVASRITLVILFLAAFMLPSCGNDPAPTPDSGTGTCTTPGTTAFLQTCTMDSNCMSCLCKNFGHTTVCTKTCTGNGDCPTPSGGCTDGTCRP